MRTLVRTASIALVGATWLFGGCVDAPITADQLQADGSLRVTRPAQAAFSAPEPTTQVQQAVRISAVLAAESDGALRDRSEFAIGVERVHLHVRADGLLEPRSVVYRWTHDGVSVLVPGTLAPTGQMSLGASFDIGEQAAGSWSVEVLTQSEPGQRPHVLFHRKFNITSDPLAPAPAF